jgi:hypothetical protein
MQGNTLTNFVLTGSNFDPNATVSFGGIGIAVASYTSHTPDAIVASVVIAGGAPPEPQDVIVTNPDSQQAKAALAFTVNPAPAAPQAAISVAPNPLDFGVVPINKSVIIAAHVRNIGTAPLIVTDVSISDPSFTLSQTITGTINPGDESALFLSFKPTQQGRIVGVLKITSNAATPVTFIHLLGAGSNLQSGRLSLVYSNDAAPNHPIFLTATPTSRTGKEIIADVTLTNVTGTWYEVTVSSSAGTTSAPNPIPVQNIPFDFLIGPGQQKLFKGIHFPDGEYLQLDAKRISEEAVLVLAIDLIGRGIFGERLTDFAPNGFIDLGGGALLPLLATVRQHCAGPALALGTTVGSTSNLDLERDLKIISRLSDFMRCTVEDEATRDAIGNLITSLYNNSVAQQWLVFSFKTINQVIFLITHVSLLVDLADQTLTAAPDGFARIDAIHP